MRFLFWLFGLMILGGILGGISSAIFIGCDYPINLLGIVLHFASLVMCVILGIKTFDWVVDY